MGNDYIAKITDTADNRLIMEVHFYGPYQFCQMEEDAYWGKQWYYWGKDNQSGDAAVSYTHLECRPSMFRLMLSLQLP